MKAVIDHGEFSTLVRANGDGRNEAIMRAAVELFAHIDNPAHKDVLHFEELCLRLLPKLSFLSRAEIAEKLGKIDHLPRSVALHLAQEDITVAAPLLKTYTGFNEEDLLIILARCDEAHALAISSRPFLSDKLLCALSSYGLNKVTPRMTPPKIKVNPSKMADSIKTPRITVQTATNGVRKIRIEAAKADKAADKTNSKPFTPDLEWVLSAEHAYILTHLNEVEENLKQSKVKPADILSSAFERALGARDFTNLVHRSDKHGFSTLLAQQCGLEQDEASRIINDEKGFALALCIKSLSLPKELANEAFILLNSTRSEDIQQIYLLDWFYETISPAAARQVVGYWNQGQFEDKKLPGTHQSVHSGQTRAQAQPTREHLGNMGQSFKEKRKLVSER